MKNRLQTKEQRQEFINKINHDLMLEGVDKSLLVDLDDQFIDGKIDIVEYDKLCTELILNLSTLKTK